jgi:hypothetical protein
MKRLPRVCHCEAGFASRSNLAVKDSSPLLGLPAQEGISHSIDDVPDIGGVSLVQGDCDYIPTCT